MDSLELESSEAAYRADFVVYGMAALGLGSAVVIGAPGPAWAVLAVAFGGYFAWTILEYALHRFVLHRVQPFRAMHEQHHLRPHARIGTPTVVSAPLFALLVLAPAWWLVGPWWACALTLGVVLGYIAYAITHHVCHTGGPADSAWSQRHKRWHGRHHRSGKPGCYGVSHRLWDHIFGTNLEPSRTQGTVYWHLD